MLPVDVVAAVSKDHGPEALTVSVEEIPASHMALDIGPDTIKLFGKALSEASTIVWNGPVGMFEVDEFSRGTRAIAEIIARSDAVSISGGGDTNAAVLQSGVSEQITYMSTGGGAFLHLLEGRSLPAVDALKACE